MVTVVPLMVQAPEAPRETAKPEVAVAETVKVVPNTALPGAPVKLMVWLIRVRETVNGALVADRAETLYLDSQQALPAPERLSDYTTASGLTVRAVRAF